MARNTVIGLLIPILLLLLQAALCAQTASTGGITGVVTDPSGAAVPGATVAIRSGATGEERTFASDSAGNFSATLLPPGKYTVTVQKPGFAPLTIKDVTVLITERTPVNAQLRLGATQESITVTGMPPLLQSTNATIGRVIEHETVVNLPLVNRNYTQILGLTSGTNMDVVDATSLGNGSQEIRANGARSGDNNFMINGVDANSYGTNLTEVTAFGAGGIAIPAPDAIQEFKVQTSLYDAQYGRGAGANVNVETRSGTSAYHGNVYFFGRNDVLNANNFFSNATGVRRGKFLRSQPGFTLGGPLIRDRAFFFGSYQATRDVNGASLASSVRSLALPPIPVDRSLASLGAVFGGQTGAFGGVAIAPDGSNINPVALKLLNLRNTDGSFLIPSPQTSSRGVNYTASIPGRFNDDQFNINLDLNLRPPDRLSLKLFRSNSSEFVPFFGATVPGFPTLRSYWNRNLAVSETHIFSPALVNQVRFGYSRIAGKGSPGGTATDAEVGIRRFSDPEDAILPQMQVLGAFTLGNSLTDLGKSANNNFYYSDIASYSRGRHNLRAGAEVFRNQYNLTFVGSTGFLLTLSFPDFLLGLAAGPVAAGGNDTPVSNIFFSTIGSGIPHTGNRATAVGTFAEDDFRVSSGLIFNLGLRLEANGQQDEAFGRQSNFFPQFYRTPPPGGFTGVGTSGYVLPDNFQGSAPPGIPRKNPALVSNPTQWHVEPRIGLAWSPLGGRDFVVRSGYGIYATRVSFVGEGATLVFNPPFTVMTSLRGGLNALATLQHPFPDFPKDSAFPDFQFNQLPGPPFNGTDRILQAPAITDPDFKEATVQQYSLDLQYQHKSYVFTLGYVGAKGTHLAVGRSNNQAILASSAHPVNGITTNSVDNASLRVPFLGLAPFLFRLESSGNSIYNSLQVTVKKELSHGFQLLAGYTLSKSIDDAGDNLGSAVSGNFGVPIVGELVFNNQNNVRAQRGLSDFDRRHRFVLSYVWNLPAPQRLVSRNPVGAKILQGWAISGVTTAQSGLPFSILDSGGGSLFGSPSLFFTADLAPGKTLADAKRGGSVESRLNEFFDRSAFTFAPFIPDGGLINGQFPVSGGGTIFGNLGRNILRGPNQADFDIGISKGTALTEKVSLLIRWELFNAFNHPNFANPTNDIEAGPGSFGVISGLTVNPRIMQFAAKIEF